jgi:DNA-binding PadR family transcriptional regulator
LEETICACALELLRGGVREFHGFEIAKHVADGKDHRLLTAYGTLYRALGRLEQMGLLESRAEDPEIPAREGRPGRRLYTLTAAGETAAAEIRKRAGELRKQRQRRPRRRLAPA